LIDALLAELEQFTGDEWEQEDDITLLTLQRFHTSDLGVGRGRVMHRAGTQASGTYSSRVRSQRD
jgi:hypothetical protein